MQPTCRRQAAAVGSPGFAGGSGARGRGGSDARTPPVLAGAAGTSSPLAARLRAQRKEDGREQDTGGCRAPRERPGSARAPRLRRGAGGSRRWPLLPAARPLLPEENGAAGELPVSGGAVLTHGRRSGLCPCRGCERAGVAAQEGLPERGGDPASIWSRKIKVTGGASGSWGKAGACRRRRGKAHPLSVAGRPGVAPVLGWGLRGLPRSPFVPT